MANSGTHWSDMELNQLKELAGHFPAAHISEQIGRGLHGVLKKIRELGLKSYSSNPHKPRPVASRVPSAVPDWAKTTPSKIVAPLKPTNVRKASVRHISYPPLEWCENCHGVVSSWSDHESQMSHMGCKRPAA
jgi:hypothetical protein